MWCDFLEGSKAYMTGGVSRDLQQGPVCHSGGRESSCAPAPRIRALQNSTLRLSGQRLEVVSIHGIVSG